MKGIKSDWMRPLLYLESQSQEKVIFDNDTYIINKGALANATNLRFAFKRLLDSLCKANSLDENNFAKEYKQLKEDSKYFFKMLNNYVKLGYREMHENLKEILLPLRILRKRLIPVKSAALRCWALRARSSRPMGTVMPGRCSAPSGRPENWSAAVWWR
jgi:hypothetical protein